MECKYFLFDVEDDDEHGGVGSQDRLGLVQLD